MLQFVLVYNMVVCGFNIYEVVRVYSENELSYRGRAVFCPRKDLRTVGSKKYLQVGRCIHHC